MEASHDGRRFLVAGAASSPRASLHSLAAIVPRRQHGGAPVSRPGIEAIAAVPLGDLAGAAESSPARPIRIPRRRSAGSEEGQELFVEDELRRLPWVWRRAAGWVRT